MIVISQNQVIKTAVLSSALILACQNVATLAAPSSWRRFVSAAHLDLNTKDGCLKAITVYDDAIKMIEKSNPDSEAKYDLYLNLAESYRRAGKLDQANKILESVAPIILKGNWLDPLLVTRYWRRRAELCFSQGLYEEYVEALIRANKILRQYLPQSGMRDFAQPLINLISVHNWKAAAVLMRQIRSRHSFDTRSNEINESCINGVCYHITSYVCTHLSEKDFDYVQELLSLLTEFDRVPKRLLRTWIGFLSVYPMLKALSPECEHALVKLAEQSRTASDEISLRSCLEGIVLERKGDLLGALKAYERAYEAAGQAKNIEEQNIACERITACVSSNEQSKTASIELLQEEQKLTDLQHIGLWKLAGEDKFNRQNVRILLRIAVEYARFNRISDAELALQGVSMARTKGFPFYPCRVLLPKIEICRSFIRQNELQKAEKGLKEIKEMLAPCLCEEANGKGDFVFKRVPELLSTAENEFAARSKGQNNAN